jgi:hypothetical protein
MVFCSTQRMQMTAHILQEWDYHSHTYHGTLGDDLCDGLQGSDSYDATSHAQTLPVLLH